MIRFVQIFYSLIINPLLFFLAHLLVLFNKKWRKAVRERYGIGKKIRQWQESAQTKKKPVLIHAASMGEFEHIKPVVEQLKKKKIPLILMFFSPSGYEHVKRYPGIELIIYAPFDFAFCWRRILKKIQPRFLLISKHDVWPNQVWACAKLKIPVFLINASLHSESSRVKAPWRYLHKHVYGALSAIYSISGQDEKRFKQFFPGSKTQVTGDTKFDQVLQRKQKRTQSMALGEKWQRKKETLLFGSIWPEDSDVILPALKQILRSFPQTNAILVPHQPDTEFVEKLQEELSAYKVQLFSQETDLSESRVLIVDVIGILADLYTYAALAYVGGSFKQGIHNVMEPAVYGIPVLYGPVHKNSLEAVELLQEDGARLILNSSEAGYQLTQLLQNRALREQIGARALRFVQKNMGATQRLMDSWRGLLD